MPQVRLVNHLEEFHVAVEHAVDVIDGQAGMFQCCRHRLMNHFRLVHIFSVTGVNGLSHADDADISVFLHIISPFNPVPE